MASKIIILSIIIMTFLCHLNMARQLNQKDSVPSPSRINTLENFGNIDEILLSRNQRAAGIGKQSESATNDFYQLAWDDVKATLLPEKIHEWSDNESFITIVAWQDVHNNDGKLEEINTLELVIPPKDKDYVNHRERYEDQAYPADALLRDYTVNKAPLLPYFGVFEQYDQNGMKKMFTYFDQDQHLIDGYGTTYYNKTETNVSADYVEKFIAKIKSNYSQHSILRYDVDGALTNTSKVNPSFVVYVTESYEATDDMLFRIPKTLASIYELFPVDQIPQKLALIMQQDFPEYEWRVLVNQIGHFLTKDVAISLTYKNEVDGDISSPEYYVYGRKI